MPLTIRVPTSAMKFISKPEGYAVQTRVPSYSSFSESDFGPLGNRAELDASGSPRPNLAWLTLDDNLSAVDWLDRNNQAKDAQHICLM